MADARGQYIYIYISIFNLSLRVNSILSYRFYNLGQSPFYNSLQYIKCADLKSKEHEIIN